MSSSLVDQLAERLSLTPTEAEQSLRSFVDALQARLQKEGSVVVPGLGTFSREGDRIAFSADPALDLAANHRFAGLEPLPVFSPPEQETPEPATDTSPEPETTSEHPDSSPSPDLETASEPLEEHTGDDDLTDGAWIESRQPEEDHPLGPAPETFEEADFDVVKDEETATEPVDAEAGTSADDEAEDPFELLRFREEEADYAQDDEAVTGEAEATAPAPEIEETETAVPPAEVAGEETTAEDAGTPPPPTAEAAPAGPRSRPRTVRERKRMAPGIIVLVLLGLAAGAFVAYQLFSPAPPAPDSNPARSEALTPSTDTTGVTTTAVDTTALAASSDTSQVEPAATPVREEPAPPPVTGIDRAAGGWTIVVASVTSRSDAEAIARRYRDLVEPVDVLTAETNGITRYRVGVGQYLTQEAAQAAIEQLGDRLPSGSWPLRIRPGM